MAPIEEFDMMYREDAEYMQKTYDCMKDLSIADIIGVWSAYSDSMCAGWLMCEGISQEWMARIVEMQRCPHCKELIFRI